jgi:hypothetical protein
MQYREYTVSFSPCGVINACSKTNTKSDSIWSSKKEVVFFPFLTRQILHSFAQMRHISAHCFISSIDILNPCCCIILSHPCAQASHICTRWRRREILYLHCTRSICALSSWIMFRKDSKKTLHLTAGLSAIFYELHLLALNPSPALHPHRFASDQFP